jgi:hypothetical protein
MVKKLYNEISTLLEELYPKYNNVWMLQEFNNANFAVLKAADGSGEWRTDLASVPNSGVAQMTSGREEAYAKGQEQRGVPFRYMTKGNAAKPPQLKVVAFPPDINKKITADMLPDEWDDMLSRARQNTTEDSVSPDDVGTGEMRPEDIEANQMMDADQMEAFIRSEKVKVLDGSVEKSLDRVLQDVDAIFEISAVPEKALLKSVNKIFNDGRRAATSPVQKFISRIAGEEDDLERAQRAIHDMAGDVSTFLRVATKLLRSEPTPNSIDSLSEDERDSLSRLVLRQNGEHFYWTGKEGDDSTLIGSMFEKGKQYGLQIDTKAGGLTQLAKALNNLGLTDRGEPLIKRTANRDVSAQARALLGTFMEHIMVGSRSWRRKDRSGLKKALNDILKTVTKDENAPLKALLIYAKQGGLGENFQNADYEGMQDILDACGEDLGTDPDERQVFAWLAAVSMKMIEQQDILIERLCPKAKAEHTGKKKDGIQKDGSRFSADVIYNNADDECMAKYNDLLDSVSEELGGNAAYNCGRKTNAINIQSKNTFSAKKGNKSVQGSQVQTSYLEAEEEYAQTSQHAVDYLSCVGGKLGLPAEEVSGKMKRVEDAIAKEQKTVGGIMTDFRKLDKAAINTLIQGKIEGAGSPQTMALWGEVKKNVSNMKGTDEKKAESAEKKIIPLVMQAYRVSLMRENRPQFDALIAGNLLRVGMPTDEQLYTKMDTSKGWNKGTMRVGSEQQLVGQMAARILFDKVEYKVTKGAVRIIMPNAAGEKTAVGSLVSRTRSERTSQDFVEIEPSYIKANTMDINDVMKLLDAKYPDSKIARESLSMKRAFEIMIELLGRSESHLI